MTAKPRQPMTAGFKVPRGILMFHRPARPNAPYVVQWRVAGRRKQKAFDTRDAQLDFAKDLTKGVGQIGIAAYQLNPDEAREWRAFKVEIGAGVPLAAVMDCWLKYGKERPRFTVREAVEKFTEAKTAEGLAATTLKHYRPIFERLIAKLGNHDVSAVTQDEIAHWCANASDVPHTRKTHQTRARGLFSWLKAKRLIADDPCDGLKPVRLIETDVKTWTVDEVQSLFANNESEPPELLGRLALECFAGVRFGSTAKAVGNDVVFDQSGFVLPAKNIKTTKREFIDELPDNLWFWLNRSKPDAWTMTPIQYKHAKAKARIRAGSRQVHNAARHTFATHHVAANKDASKTAIILCHRNPVMLYRHYKGRATKAEGVRYFQIRPSDLYGPFLP